MKTVLSRKFASLEIVLMHAEPQNAEQMPFALALIIELSVLVCTDFRETLLLHAAHVSKYK